jgi:hypothetical protein
VVQLEEREEVRCVQAKQHRAVLQVVEIDHK